MSITPSIIHSLLIVKVICLPNNVESFQPIILALYKFNKLFSSLSFNTTTLRNSFFSIFTFLNFINDIYKIILIIALISGLIFILLNHWSMMKNE